jgi:HAMP domain-containing protein
MNNNLSSRPKKTFYLSLRWKLLTGYSLIFFFVFGGAFLWFYNFATQMAMDRIKEHLVKTLSAAIALIDADSLDGLIHEGEIRPSDGLTDDPRFWELIQTMGVVYAIEPRAQPYIFIIGESPNELIFVASACNYVFPHSSDCPKFMQHWVSNNSAPNINGLRQLTLQNDKHEGCSYYKQLPSSDPATGATIPGIKDDSCQLVAYTDDFGQWVSAFAPIPDSKGEVVAVMGMDFESDYVYEIQQTIDLQIGIIFLLVYGLLFILTFVVAEIFTRPMRSLTQVAGSIGEGDYEKSLAGLGKGISEKLVNDEISQLSSVFQIMIEKVLQNEKPFEHIVKEPQIDEGKRQEQVSGIIDTDFFYDLQQKAGQIRMPQSSPSISKSEFEVPDPKT